MTLLGRAGKGFLCAEGLTCGKAGDGETAGCAAGISPVTQPRLYSGW